MGRLIRNIILALALLFFVGGCMANEVVRHSAADDGSGGFHFKWDLGSIEFGTGGQQPAETAEPPATPSPTPEVYSTPPQCENADAERFYPECTLSAPVIISMTVNVAPVDVNVGDIVVKGGDNTASGGSSTAYGGEGGSATGGYSNSSASGGQAAADASVERAQIQGDVIGAPRIIVAGTPTPTPVTATPTPTCTPTPVCVPCGQPGEPQ